MQLREPITISRQTLVLGAAVVVLLIVVAVLATALAVRGGGESGASPREPAPAVANTPTAAQTVAPFTPPPNASPSASPSPTATATLTATSIPPTQPPPAPPPPPTAQPIPTAPPATPTQQVVQSPSNDYLKVISKDFSGGPAATVTLEYRAFPRPGGQFYISATIWKTGPGSLWCDATAIANIPTQGTVTVSFPWAAQAQGCSPATFSSLYACLAFDGKETLCVNVYK